MKNRQPKSRVARGKEKPPKGRYARVWLSSAYLAWCQRHHLNPEVAGACVVHTCGLRNAGEVIIRSDNRPTGEEMFEPPTDERKEEP